MDPNLNTIPSPPPGFVMHDTGAGNVSDALRNQIGNLTQLRNTYSAGGNGTKADEMDQRIEILNQQLKEPSNTPPPPPGFVMHDAGGAAPEPKSFLRKVSESIPTPLGVASGVLDTLNAPFRAAGKLAQSIVQPAAEAILPKEPSVPTLRGNDIQRFFPGPAMTLKEQYGPVAEGTPSTPTTPEMLGEVANQATQMYLPGPAIRGVAKVPGFLSKLLNAGDVARKTQAWKIIDTTARTQGDIEAGAGKLTEQASGRTQAELDQIARNKAVRERSVQDLINQNAGQPAATKTMQDIFPAAPSLREAGTAYKGELTPEGFQPGIYQRERKATSQYFSGKYEPLKEAGGNVAHPVDNFSAAQDSILSEVGIAKDALATPAERVAGNLKGASQEQIGSGFRSQPGGGVNLDEDVYTKLKPMLVAQKQAEVEFLSGKRAAPPAVPVDIYKAALGQTTGDQTFGQMMDNRQRLRSAVRAADDTKNDNLTRQFRTMENGLTTDMEAASKDNPAILSDLRKTDLEYALSRMQYGKRALPRKASEAAAEDVVDKIIRPASAPASEETINQAWKVIKQPAERDQILGAWFKDGVESAVDNKTGAYDASKLPQWWNKYSDETKATAFSHDPGKKAKIDELMNKIQATTEIDPTKLAAGVLTPTQQSRIAQVKGGKELKQINAAKESNLAAIGKEADSEMEKLFKQKPGFAEKMANKGLWVIGSAPYLLATGHPATAAIAAGIGGTMRFSPQIAAKMMMSAKGLDHLIQGMKIPPGTPQALIWSSRAAAIARQLGGQREESRQE